MVINVTLNIFHFDFGVREISILQTCYWQKKNLSVHQAFENSAINALDSV